MPLLDLSQDCFDILGYRTFAQTGIGNWNHGRRDLVGKVSLSSRRFREIGIESDFVLVHLTQNPNLA